jgi:hypothetical protein
VTDEHDIVPGWIWILVHLVIKELDLGADVTMRAAARLVRARIGDNAIVASVAEIVVPGLEDVAPARVGLAATGDVVIVRLSKILVDFAGLRGSSFSHCPDLGRVRRIR